MFGALSLLKCFFSFPFVFSLNLLESVASQLDIPWLWAGQLCSVAPVPSGEMDGDKHPAPVLGQSRSTPFWQMQPNPSPWAFLSLCQAPFCSFPFAPFSLLLLLRCPLGWAAGDSFSPPFSPWPMAWYQGSLWGSGEELGP